VTRHLLAIGLIALAGCAGCERPEEKTRNLFAAIDRADLEEIERRVDAGYNDPLGDKEKLLEDLRALFREVPRIRSKPTDLSPSKSRGGVVVVGTLEIELESAPSWRMIGPLAIEYDGGLSVKSGLLDDLRQIRRLFDDRRRAMEANDAEAYAALLHPEYRDGDLDRDGAIERLRKDLAGIPIRLEPLSYWVEVRGLDTHVDERYRLTVNEEPHALVARLTLRRSAGLWRIFGGLYPTHVFE
jgi:hypothetical protein